MSRIKKIIFTLIIFLSIIPITNASSNQDKIKEILNIDNNDKINIYLFYSNTCPHCQKELKYLEELKQSKYKDYINIHTYEVTTNEENNNNLKEIKKIYNVNNNGVPFTLIEDKYIIGFGEGTKDRINSTLDTYISGSNNNSYKIPILGKIDKNTSISLVAIVLGFIDGFNPCAMWILLLLINMCITAGDRKKMIYIGLLFILTGSIIYFLSMLGIGIVIDMVMVSLLRDIIAVLAIILGILNIRKYLKTKKETGCQVTNKTQRKKIITKINNILKSNNLLIASISTIALAASVNLIELACSLGFPTIFLELLSINNIIGIKKILYILIYIFFYMLDDLVVFLLAVLTLQSKGISTKYGKLVNLLGGIIMLIMGILLIFKPQWIMFNF